MHSKSSNLQCTNQQDQEIKHRKGSRSKFYQMHLTWQNVKESPRPANVSAGLKKCFQRWWSFCQHIHEPQKSMQRASVDKMSAPSRRILVINARQTYHGYYEQWQIHEIRVKHCQSHRLSRQTYQTWDKQSTTEDLTSQEKGDLLIPIKMVSWTQPIPYAKHTEGFLTSGIQAHWY